MAEKTRRYDKAYVVSGSEDGVLGVCNSGKKGIARAVVYLDIHPTEEELKGWAKTLRDEGTVTIAGFDSASAEVGVFEINFGEQAEAKAAEETTEADEAAEEPSEEPTEDEQTGPSED